MPRHAPIAVAILFVVGCMGCGGGSSSKPDAGGTGGGSLGGHRPRRRRRRPGPAAVPAPRCRRARGCSRACRRRLLDMGAPCTSEVGATGDRWCAFLDLVDADHDTALVRRQRDEGRRGYADHLRCDRRQLPQADGQLRRGHGSPRDVPGRHARLLRRRDAGRRSAWRPGMTAGSALATLDADADAVCTPSTKGTRGRLPPRSADGDADGPERTCC